MQVSSNLKCPWCFYLFDKITLSDAMPGERYALVCPRCINQFKVDINPHYQFRTFTKCEDNGLKHNWKSRHISGYDLYKKCRRCGKEDYRPAQIKLPGFKQIAT